VSPEKFSEAERAITAELAKLTDPSYYTDEQLQNAKVQLERSEMYAREIPSAFVHTVGYWWSVAGGLQYYLHYIDNLKKVTREDINTYVKKYIQGAPFVKGILVSPKDRPQILPQ
jgi:zinc protease